MLELPGLFVFLGGKGILKFFSAWGGGGTVKIAGLWFARGIRTQADIMKIELTRTAVSLPNIVISSFGTSHELRCVVWMSQLSLMI